LACEAEAQQALALVTHTLQATFLSAGTVPAWPRDGKRGRPGQGAPPTPLGYQSAGALASSLTSRQALLDQHRCVMLATNELDTTQLSPQELLTGDTGQGHAERGFRCLKDPQLFAAAFSLKKPARVMALFMGMTVCWLVSAA
jgi:hypothetical protein